MNQILFVCRENIGRSQVAMEFYNKIAPNEASSAGTMVDKPGQLLKENKESANVIRIMSNEGIDISSNKRNPLSKKLAAAYEKIIIMAEVYTVPSWLLNDKRAEIWYIKDMKSLEIPQLLPIKNEIEEKVKKLIEI